MLNALFIALSLFAFACSESKQNAVETESKYIEDSQKIVQNSDAKLTASDEEQAVTEVKKEEIGEKPEPMANKPNTGKKKSVKSNKAAEEEPATADATVNQSSIDKPLIKEHRKWTALLQKYVDSKGDVNYSGLLKNDSEALQAYLNELAQNPPRRDWTENRALAYWINAYNAFTVKMILDNWPVKSITNLHGGEPWDHKWIQLGQKTYSLNEIEHGIIREEFSVPEIHFAVNCASISCPPLLNKAYTADMVFKQLAAQTKAFINNPAYNTISNDKLQLSKLFDWYGEDFKDVRKYVKRYSSTSINDDASIAFRDYNWNLNGE